eukprot:288205_1
MEATSMYCYKINRDLMSRISNNRLHTEIWDDLISRLDFMDDQLVRIFYINKFTKNSVQICRYNGCNNQEIDGIYCVNHRICSVCNTYNTSNNLMKCIDCNNAFCVNSMANTNNSYKKHCGSQLLNQCKNCYQINENNKLLILINTFCTQNICTDIKNIIFFYAIGHMIQCGNCQQQINLDTLLSFEYNNNPA